MEPSLSLFNQPSPGSPATSAEEEQQYIQKRVCEIYQIYCVVHALMCQ